MKSKKIIIPLIHIAAWTLFLSIPFLFFSSPPGEQHGPHFHGNFFGVPEVFSYCLLIIFFYLNAYYLMPSLLSKKMTLAYILVILILIILIAATNAAVSDFHRPHFPPRPFMRLFTFKIYPCLFNFAI